MASYTRIFYTARATNYKNVWRIVRNYGRQSIEVRTIRGTRDEIKQLLLKMNRHHIY